MERFQVVELNRIWLVIPDADFFVIVELDTESLIWCPSSISLVLLLCAGLVYSATIIEQCNRLVALVWIRQKVCDLNDGSETIDIGVSTCSDLRVFYRLMRLIKNLLMDDQSSYLKPICLQLT